MLIILAVILSELILMFDVFVEMASELTVMLEAFVLAAVEMV